MIKNNTENECPFCNLNRMAVIFESNCFRAIYNKYPTVVGHSLITTKRHLHSLTQLTMEEWIELKEVSNTLLDALRNYYKTESFDYAVQEGFAAGGTIDHFHIHVIPRKVGDLSEPDQWYPELVRQNLDPSERKKVELSLDEMNEFACLIKTSVHKNRQR